MVPTTGDDSTVDLDHVNTAWVATKHLIGRGARRLATITGAVDLARVVPAGCQV